VVCGALLARSLIDADSEVLVGIIYLFFLLFLFCGVQLCDLPGGEKEDKKLRFVTASLRNGDAQP
jgi:hypothetical protein